MPLNYLNSLVIYKSPYLEDRDEYLHTYLSNYLVCKAKTSQKRLLAELREFDDWTESWAYLPRETMHREGFILKDQ
jgi:hypothetical protein